MEMYRFLDIFFMAVHAILVLFILTGWIWKKTRRVHLIVMALTFFSWFGLGLFYGFGYCPCTEWHWQVKAKLGETPLPASYVKYHLDLLTGLDLDRFAVDGIVLLLGLAALCASILLSRRDRRRSTGQGGG